MRSKEEIGYLTNYGKEVNDAYALYASLYLDCCDDNLRHFYCREVDFRPIRDIDREDETVLANAYMKHALDIAQETINCMTKDEAMNFLANYPSLPIDRLEIGA